MHVSVHFDLEIDPAEWEGRHRGVAQPVRLDHTTLIRITNEVRAHAENVIRDLYEDQGWAVAEQTNA